jgi:hypothetical protein
MQTTIERPTAATPHRFDVDDYCRMAAAGILSPKDRVELIAGEIGDMAPIGSEHGGTTDCLTSLVARAAADRRVQMRVQCPLRVDRHNEPQPDLMLPHPQPDFCRSGHPTAADACFCSRSPTARSTTTAARSSPFTPATTCLRTFRGIMNCSKRAGIYY